MSETPTPRHCHVSRVIRALLSFYGPDPIIRALIEETRTTKRLDSRGHEIHLVPVYACPVHLTSPVVGCEVCEMATKINLETYGT